MSVLAALALGGATLARPSLAALPPPMPCPTASCLMALGGGAMHSGGGFPQPRTRGPRCWPTVEQYLTTGAYLADVAEAVASAREVLAAHPRPSRGLAVIFDIDETSLSNVDEWKGVMGAAGAGLGLEPGLATDASTILDAARLRAAAPALAATRALYADAFAAGYSVAFVTGRRDRGGMRNATVANLAAAGYGGPCDPRGGMGDTVATAPLPLPKPATSPPLCYSALLMRGGGDVRPASEVKPELRAALTAGGLEVVASLGDQFSDLTGPDSAPASFKMPNPVYYILMPAAPAVEARTSAALAALAAAGGDADALGEAVEGAAWLDAVPGDGRQALRAARSRLRALIKAEAGKDAAASAVPEADRSPHVKQTYDASEFEALASKYEALAWRAVARPGGATTKPDAYYALYGLHMQATKGDVVGERPMWAERGGLDFDGRARWDAWAGLRGKKDGRAKLEFAYYEFTPRALYSDGR